MFKPKLGSSARSQFKMPPYKMELQPGLNTITYKARNGDNLPKAFIAVIEFRDTSGNVVGAPYDAFAFSKKTGAYQYVPGGTPAKPSSFSLRFAPPSRATTIIVTVKSWDSATVPDVQFELHQQADDAAPEESHKVTPKNEDYMRLSSSENVLTFNVRSGDNVTKAHVAIIRFWDAESRLVEAPYDGFSYSPKTGAYVYLPGASAHAPRHITVPFTSPPGAVSVSAETIPWASEEPPQVDCSVLPKTDTDSAGAESTSSAAERVSGGDGPAIDTYRFELAPRGNLISLDVCNGDGLPKAFVVSVQFHSQDGNAIPAPHQGFFLSKRVGSYQYVAGGAAGRPALNQIRFDAPDGAATIELRVLPWHSKANPELVKPPQLSTVAAVQSSLPEADIRNLRHRLLEELKLPSRPCNDPALSKRICYVLHNSFPHATGGYATRAHGLAKAIQAEGTEVVAVTRPGFPLDTMKLPAEDARHVTLDGIRYHRLAGPWRKGKHLYEYMLSCVDEYEAIFRDLRPTAVLAASFYYSAMPAMIAARRLGLPFIYEVRGLAELTKLSRDATYADSEAFNETVEMDTATCMAADRVFTLTGGMGSILKERGVPPDRISIIPNAVNTEVFTPSDRDAVLAASYAIPSDVPVIGYVGGIVDYEGLDDLVTSCGALKQRGLEFRLLIVGSDSSSTEGGFGPLARDLQKSAADLGMSDWLIMPGRVSHDEARRHYSLIDIAPLPRKAWPVCETVSPMKPLEALSMRKAVVVSSVAALAEMIDHERTGLVFQKANVDALTEALQRLILDPDLRTKLGAAGRDFVVTQRSWSHSAKLGLSVVDSLIRH
jgi:glycosyltransferase involved in cell wall biosynthesis